MLFALSHSWLLRSCLFAGLAVVLFGEAALPGIAEGDMSSEPSSGSVWFITPTLSGLTGLIRVPTTETLPDGVARIGWNSQNTMSTSLGGSTTYHASVGFLPRVELATGVGDKDLNFDFLGNAKMRLCDETGKRPAVAFGVMEIKRTQPSGIEPTAFLLASYRGLHDRAQVTAGFAGGGNTGVLAGASYQIGSCLQMQGEYDTHRFNYALAIQPLEGLTIRAANLDIGTTLTASYQFGIRLPSAASERKRVAAPVEPVIPTVDPLTAVQRSLVELGLEDVQVMLVPAGDYPELVMAYEDRRFTVNTLDGVMTVLAQVDAQAPVGIETYTIVLKRRGLVIERIATNVALFRQYVAGETTQQEFLRQLAVEILPSQALPATPSASTRIANRPYGHTDLIVGPGITSQIGTENAVVRAGVYARPEIVLPVVGGLAANARWSYPIGGELTEGVPKSFATDRATLAYAFRPGFGMLAQAHAGRLAPQRDGGVLEIARPLGDAAMGHGVIGIVNHTTDDTRRLYAVGEYWRILPYDLQLRVVGGQFLEGDRGVGADIIRFYGDTQISLGLRATGNRRLIEAHVVVPLSPREQPQRPSLLRVRTPDYLDYRLRSIIAGQGQGNFLDEAELMTSELTLGTDLLETFFDRNRLLPASVRQTVR